MDTRPLRKKVQALQCHFTWHFLIKDKVEVEHILQTVALRVKHTPYRNRSTFIALRAYLHQLQGSFKEALRSLQEAEDVLKQDHPSNFSRQALLTYGNYAWLYYHLSNYDMVECYLSRIHGICQSLSSPEPYSVLIPEIQAQKGWSLLAMGFRNGEEAKKCFQMALRGDPPNIEFQAGLALSVFASWTHSWADDLQGEAKGLMEELLLRQLENDEIKVHLASLLQRTDRQRASHLVEDVIQNSLNPEVLRNAARVCRAQSLHKAISVLQRAIALCPSYHLLHYDLGVQYMKLMKGANPDRKGEMVVAAIESFKRAVELQPESVFSRLNLAKMYGEKAPAYAEEIYQNLMDELPCTSQRCQQAIYLHWGDFLLQRKGLKTEALEMYKAGFTVLGDHAWERKQLKQRLMNLARMLEKDRETGRAQSVYSFVQATENPGLDQRATCTRPGDEVSPPSSPAVQM